MDDIYNFFSKYFSDFISSDSFIIAIIENLIYCIIISVIVIVIISVNRSSKRRNYNQRYTYYYQNSPNAQLKGAYFYPDLSANCASKKYKAHKVKNSGMDLFLSVPYEEKNEAKKNGAWRNRNQWYIK